MDSLLIVILKFHCIHHKKIVRTFSQTCQGLNSYSSPFSITILITAQKIQVTTQFLNFSYSLTFSSSHTSIYSANNDAYIGFIDSCRSSCTSCLKIFIFTFSHFSNSLYLMLKNQLSYHMVTLPPLNACGHIQICILIIHLQIQIFCICKDSLF